MALIHILDRQTDEIIGTLNIGQYMNDSHKISVDNLHTFDFTALNHFDKLQKRNRLLLQDIDGFFHEFIIEYTEQFNRTEKTIYSNASYLALQKAKVIEPQTLAGTTARLAAELALSGTEFEAGFVEVANIRTLVISEYTNPYKLLKMIASEFEAELRFRIVVDGNRIVGRYVDILKPKEEFEGKETVFGKDLVGLRRKEDSQNIVTALLGIGPEREDGTRLTVFVEDQDALQRWGRKGKHLIEVYEPQSFDSEMTLERLTTLTENELKKRIDSLVEYECDASVMEHLPNKGHEKVRLGNTIRIKDDGYEPPLYLEARILEVIYQPSTNKISSFKLGNYKEYKKEDLENQIKLLKELLKQKASNAELQTVYESALQQAEEKANQAEANAKVYAETVSQEAESNAKNHADVVSQQAENNAKSHADLVAEQKKLEAINAAIADAEQKVNQAKTELEADIATKADATWVNGQLVLKENAITKSSTAPSNPTAGQLWLDTSVTPNVLKRWSGSAWVKATPTSAGEVGAYTKIEVDNALNSKVSVTQYTTDMNGVVTRLNSAESRITQNENEIATKVSNTTYQQDKTTINNNISQLQTKMSNAETSISQLSSQIALKANATDVYTKSQIDGQFSTVNQQISQLDAELSIQADQIATKVSRTEFEALQIGGRNLFFNSADFAGWSVYNVQSAVVSTDIPLKNINAKSITWKVGTISNTGGYYQRFRNDNGNTKFTNGQVYTVSAWAKASADATLAINVEGISGARKDFNLTTNWRKIQLTFTGNGSAHTITFYGTDSSKSITFYLALPKLEEGNRATDWTPAPEDVQGQIDGLGTRVNSAETSITQLSNQIQLKANQSEVDTLTNRISQAESSITLLSDEIDLKVNKDGVISAINQTAESIKIQASKVDLSGYVTFTNLSTPGQTTIDGGNIKANSITANKLNVTSLSAISANLGTVTAGTITGVNITGSTITQNTSGGSIILNNNGLTVRDSSGKDRIQIQTSTSPLFPDPSYLVFEPTRGTGKVIVGTSLHGLTDGLFLGFPEDTSESTSVLIKCIGKPDNAISFWSPRVLVTGGTLYLSPNRYASAGGGLDASNSDIINVNALYFSDPSSGTVLSALSGGSVDLLDPTGLWTNLYLRPRPDGEVRVTAYGSWSQYRPIRASSFPTGSMAEYKEDIRVWERSALEQIRQATIYEYYLKTELEQGIYRKRQGLVIGEGYNTPEGVVDGDGVEQYLMNAWSWKAIQELDSEQVKMKDEIEGLKLENQYLKQKIQQLEEMMVA